MPDITGTLRPPRLGSPPSSPALGQIYYDNSTTPGVLYWWDGTTWKSASGGSAAPEVSVGPNAPTRNQEVIWIDTDESPPAVTRDINMDVWHTVGGSGEPAFGAGCSVAETVQFRKDNIGHVQIRGAANAPAVGASSSVVLFTLPVGFRPVVLQRFPILQTYGAAMIRVDTDGSVRLFNTPGMTAASAAGIAYLDPVEFDTDTVTAVTSTVAVPMEPWHNVGAAGEPPLLNGWTNPSPASYGALGFRKDPYGKVQLRGQVSAGTNNTPPFFLPPGYRPSVGCYFTCLGDNGAAGNYVLVGADGSVSCTRAGTNLWLNLIEFDTDTVGSYVAGIVATPTLVSVLPPSPIDLQEVDLVVDDAGTYGGPYIWRCKYRAASAGSYKWHVIGPPSLISEVTANTGGFTTVGWVSGTLPNMTLPFSGDWDITTYAMLLYKAGASGYGYVAPSISGSTPSAIDGLTQYSLNAQDNVLSQEITKRKNGIAGSRVIQLQGYVSGGTLYPNNNGVGNPIGIRARPVRIG